MDRREKTKLLSRLLEAKLNSDKSYWASEVSVDFITSSRKRIDYMTFRPKNQSSSGIDKGIFTCYEVKSCIEDYNSGHGLNFLGEKNYIVTDVPTCKKIGDIYPIGIYVPVPVGKEILDELSSPTELSEDIKYNLVCANASREIDRQHPMNVLLFCMIRSGK